MASTPCPRPHPIFALELVKENFNSCTILPSPALMHGFETLCPNNFGTSLSECPVQTCGSVRIARAPDVPQSMPSDSVDEAIAAEATTGDGAQRARQLMSRQARLFKLDCRLVRLTLLRLQPRRANAQRF